MWRVAALLAILVGCADGTAIIVEVEGSALNVPADIDQLRISAVGDRSGLMAELTASLDGTWPQTLAIRPGEAGTDETVRITVEGLLGGARVLQRVLSPADFANGREVTLTVVLERECLGVVCPTGVDCLAGRCEGGLPDAGMDSGRDAGDVGPRDGGSDAPRVDAGDAGSDAGMDGGTDVGTDTGPPDTGPPDTGPIDAGFGTVIFSEYVEGSSFYKALEIYNASATTLDLSTCTLARYQNGAATPMGSLVLSGTLASRTTFVACHPMMPMTGPCDLLDLVINHNGDDGYSLTCGGMLMDTFGANTGDPGTEWTGGGVGTADITLRRKPSIVRGDTNLGDVFDPSVEWDPFASDTVSGLGTR